ncbi:hypothetical protein QCA50_010117 [Cerrena zonata]|uniref:F-box domain-containing protein n=1 Tax=Cerrena zonata TaxID=2478898 RepID=A0AAW0G498_9APHY
MAPGSKRKKVSETTEESKPLKRFARTRKGKLEELPNMPLDIIYEIFFYLLPLDILNLSRTNKAFHALLMDRSAAPFWIAARQNVPGLPEPFPGMSEPAFANLCFYPCCHICLKPQTQEVIWEYRARLCHACKKTSTESYLTLRHSDFYLKEMDRLLPYIDASVVGKTESEPEDWRRGIPRMFVSDKEEIETAWNALQDDTEEARKDFLNTQDKRYKEMRKHADLCKMWDHNKKLNRTNELYRIKLKRYDAIIAKLQELGYEEDIAFSKRHLRDKEALENHPFVRQSKPLTNRTWESHCADIFEFIEHNITPRRLYHEYRQNICTRIEILRRLVLKRMSPTLRPFFPRMRELVSFPEVQTMMDPFKSVKFDSQSRDHLVSIRDDLVASWEADCIRQLKESIRSAAPNLPEDDTILKLAIANLVVCTDGFCHTVFVDPWPSGVTHDCTFFGYRLHNVSGDRKWDDAPHSQDQDQWYDYIMNHILGYKWSKAFIRPLAHGIEKIVEISGKDPLQVTAAEMDQLDLRFFCARKVHRTGIIEILEWRQAAVQEAQSQDFNIRRPGKNDDENRHDWKIIPTEVREKIAHLELALKEFNGNYKAKQDIWHCAYCTIKRGTQANMIAHIKASHGIDTPKETDVFTDPEQVLQTNSSMYIVCDTRKEFAGELDREVEKAIKEDRVALESEICGTAIDWFFSFPIEHLKLN